MTNAIVRETQRVVEKPLISASEAYRDAVQTEGSGEKPGLISLEVQVKVT